MAHHHRLLHDNSAAIFSPSVARIAASTARDWSYVETWLVSKFPSRNGNLPPFERNQDTLKALLALASLNEAADDQHRLLAKANMVALQDRNSATNNLKDTGISPRMKYNLLDSIEQHLPKEGTVALDVLSCMGAEAGAIYPDPEDLGRTMIRLQGSIYEMEQMAARVEVLERHLHSELSEAEDLLRNLQTDDFKPPSNLAKQNLDVQRRIKAMSAQLPDLHDRVNALIASVGNFNHPTIFDITQEEQAYLALMARKREVDTQLASFAGLPNDLDVARTELDTMRARLRGINIKRDAEFEGLIEREELVERK